MKTKFYGVVAEIFEGRYSGTNQGVIERVCAVMPKSQCRKLDGMTAFKIWFASEAIANEVCEGVKTGDLGVDFLTWIMASKPWTTAGMAA